MYMYSSMYKSIVASRRQTIIFSESIASYYKSIVKYSQNISEAVGAQLNQYCFSKHARKTWYYLVESVKYQQHQ